MEVIKQGIEKLSKVQSCSRPLKWWKQVHWIWWNMQHALRRGGQIISGSSVIMRGA